MSYIVKIVDNENGNVVHEHNAVRAAVVGLYDETDKALGLGVLSGSKVFMVGACVCAEGLVDEIKDDDEVKALYLSYKEFASEHCSFVEEDLP